MINLFSKTASQFNTNGEATLIPIECFFSCAINGVWQLEMTLPYDAEERYKLIDYDKILKVSGIEAVVEQTSSYQLFRIYDYRKGDDNVYILAYPIGLDARYDTYGSITAYDKTPAQAISQINGVSQKYTVSTDITDTDTYSMAWANTNIIAMLNGDDSFVNTFGGEIVYDNYNIKVNDSLGRDTGAPEVRYGKNIMGMEIEYDISNVISRLYPIANSGEALNAIAEYKIADTQYIDADNASDYPIPHIGTVIAPYNLIQLSDDGSNTYRSSIEIYGAIKDATAIWLNSALTGTNTGNYGALLSDIELGWLDDCYGLTMIKDGTQGVVEYLWRKVINATGYVIRSGSMQSLIYNAMKEAFDDVLKNDDSGVYIGSATKRLLAAPGISPTTYFYTYEWDTVGAYRVKPFSDDYMWVYANSKWNQLNSNGLTTGTTDSKTWKWYKVSGKSWKRYGNKSKKRYLKDYQHWEISDVWYQFGSDGHGVSGADYYNAMIGFIENFQVSNKTLVSKLAPICKGAEQTLFTELYNNMGDYSRKLFNGSRLSYPSPKINIDVVDLSKTTEYADYSGMLTIKLGDTVKCTNTKLGMTTDLRVTGVTFDVLRGYNSQLTIGLTENSVVQLLDAIGKDNSTFHGYTAGEGILINGQTISAIPQEGKIKDVTINGQSVVFGGRANIDLDQINGEGLQWFEETEDALYGVVDDYEMSLVNDPIYRTVQAGCNTENGAWSFSITGMDTDVITVFIPKNYVIIPYAQMAIAEPGGIFIMTNDVTKFSSFGITAVDHWVADENEFGSITWNEGSTEGTTIDFLQEDGEPGIANFKMARSAVSVDGEMWYCVYFFSGYDKLESIMPSISTYLSASQIPVHGDVPGFESLAEVISTLVPLTRIIPASDHNYNGLSREGDLAFFAGANDEHGNGARIKIYRDGTYDGFDMVGATSSANGKKGVVPQPLIADKDKFLRGDGTWANPSGSGGTGTQAIAYKYLTPTAYGNLSSAEKSNGMLYLISDNGDGSTGFFTNYRVISPTDYENLTTAEKENGTLYLVTSNSNNAMGINVVVEDEADYTSASDNLLYLLKEA